ncbi:3'-5' exonuclease [Desulfobaculum sp. SPO524]|uniref:3'-5' exonuclease n=1 Tax=Desulfobaculum sp. SPO524 TaxID=3378071 RepID=UPI0038524FB1
MLMTDISKYQGKIAKDEIMALPLRAWEGETELVNTPEAVPDALNALSAARVLGFDTESRPAFRKGKYYPPSLIQLATADKVFIFQLSKLEFPDGLCDVLSNPAIVKTGVAVRDDIKDLQNIKSFPEDGFVDLGVVAQALKLETHGLRNLAAKFLGFRISKSARCTNWANPRLTKQQIAYAATDAWVSREIYMAMDDCGLFDIQPN